MNYSKQRGFSLIELLIVVVIIMIIAAIAIPSLLRSRQAANEGAAIAAVNQVITAQTSYAAAYPDLGYAPNLSALGPGSSPPDSAHAGLINDPGLVAGNKNGYTIALANSTSAGSPVADGYTISATPQSGKGTRTFCANETGIVRQVTSGTCNPATSPVVQ